MRFVGPFFENYSENCSLTEDSSAEVFSKKKLQSHAGAQSHVPTSKRYSFHKKSFSERIVVNQRESLKSLEFDRVPLTTH